MNFKDQNNFLNFICFIFIHLANKAFQITVKHQMQFTLNFLIYPRFSNRIETGFTTQLPSETPGGVYHALLGNSAYTYARTPLKWGLQNYTLCPCSSRHGSNTIPLSNLEDLFLWCTKLNRKRRKGCCLKLNLMPSLSVTFPANTNML